MSGREGAIQNELLAWAGSDNGYTFLLKIASGLLKEVECNGTLTAVWPYPLPAVSNIDVRNDVIEEVAQDFSLFLVEYFIPQLPKHPEHIHLAESGNFKKLFEYARNKFLWQWKEKARSKKLNPCGYLYRRLRETISNDPQFETHNVAGSALLYRLRKDGKQDKFTQTIFQIEEFPSWPILPKISSDAPQKEVFRTDYIKMAARFFWDEAIRRGNVQAISVRYLNAYIISQHPWLLVPVMVSESADIGVEDGMDLESWRDMIVSVKSMAALAEHLVTTWSRQQCRVFLLRLEEPPVKMKAIAEDLGLHDHNKVHRLFVSCKESIISFSSNWPGPPLSELPEVCGEVFLEQIKKNAKNRTAARNEK